MRLLTGLALMSEGQRSPRVAMYASAASQTEVPEDYLAAPPGLWNSEPADFTGRGGHILLPFQRALAPRQCARASAINDENPWH